MQIRSNSTEGQQQTGPATSLLKCIATGDGTNQNINKNPSYHNRQIRLFKKCAFLTASFLLLCLESMTLGGKNELKVTVWKITSFWVSSQAICELFSAIDLLLCLLIMMLKVKSAQTLSGLFSSYPFRLTAPSSGCSRKHFISTAKCSVFFQVSFTNYLSFHKDFWARLRCAC